MNRQLPSQSDIDTLSEASDELDNAFDSISGENPQISTPEDPSLSSAGRGLPTNNDFSGLADSGDDLDNAFDSISGENPQISTPEDPSLSSAGRGLPTNNDFSGLAESGDDLDNAFDSISGENPQISTPEDPSANGNSEGPLVTFGGAPNSLVEDESEVDDFALDGEDDFALGEEHEDSSGFGAALGEAWKGCRAYSGTSSLWGRSRRCAALLEATSAHQPDDARDGDLRSRLTSAGEKHTSLEQFQEYSKRRIQAQKELQEALVALENELEVHEKAIATSWLRTTYPFLELDAAAKAAYFESIVQRADLSPEWWERVTLLAVASATKLDETGKLQLLDVENQSVLWDGLLPESSMTPQAIGASVQFFQDAIGRLRELDSVDELFSTGFYLDIVGYQISLREGFFRPEVLYACVDFHVELSNWLNAEDNRVAARSRVADLAKTYEDVRSIFKSQFSDRGSADRLRARLRGDLLKKSRNTNRARAGNFGAQKKQRQGNGSRLKLVLAAVTLGCLLFLGYPLVRDFLGERSRDLESMSAASVLQFHSLLTSGNIGKDASLLLGKVDGDKWILLSAEQRETFAGEILSSATSLDLRNVMLYSDAVMILQISEGELRYLE